MQSPISMLTVILLSAIFAFAFSRHHHHTKHHHNNRINTDDSSPQSSISTSYLPRVCPAASDSAEKWQFCPKPQSGNVIDWPCVRFSDLCNGLKDCPGGSDEDPEICFFHNLMRQELNSLRKTVYDEFSGSTRKTAKTEKSSQTTDSNEWVKIEQL